MLSPAQWKKVELPNTQSLEVCWGWESYREWNKRALGHLPGKLCSCMNSIDKSLKITRGIARRVGQVKGRHLDEVALACEFVLFRYRSLSLVPHAYFAQCSFHSPKPPSQQLGMMSFSWGLD